MRIRDFHTVLVTSVHWLKREHGIMHGETEIACLARKLPPGALTISVKKEDRQTDRQRCWDNEGERREDWNREREWISE